ADPGIADRAAEIAGQRGTEYRNAARKPRVVTRQRRKSIGRWLVLGVVKLARTRRFFLALVEREDQRAGDRHCRNCGERHEHSLRDARDRCSLGPQAQVGCNLALAAVPMFAHQNSLPSVRTMRTRLSDPRSPRRSSAAAKRRSTIMWLPRTR